MKLDCRRTQRMIQPYLEDELNDGDCASFLAHVRSCEKCRDELETSFMILYALKYLDDESDRSYDIEKLLDEHLARSENRLRRNHVLSVLVWVVIVFMALLIAFIVAAVFFPQILPEFGRTIVNLFVDGFNAVFSS